MLRIEKRANPYRPWWWWLNPWGYAIQQDRYLRCANEILDITLPQLWKLQDDKGDSNA